MKKTIKKITEFLIALIAAIALVMMTAEAETMRMQLISTFGSMTVLYICYKLIERIDPDIFKEERDVEI